MERKGEYNLIVYKSVLKSKHLNYTFERCYNSEETKVLVKYLENCLEKASLLLDLLVRRGTP